MEWRQRKGRDGGAQLSRGRRVLRPRWPRASAPLSAWNAHIHITPSRLYRQRHPDRSALSRQLPVDRRANCTSRRRPQPNSHVVMWNCQTWYTFGIPTGVQQLQWNYLITFCVVYLSGARILENWILRTNNGLSQVSYFGCWSQRGTSLFYHVHRRTLRWLGHLI